ncbi:outer membrane beta-barrel family protein [Emticicia sp. C21]|uniref:outer membrane beta-barrel family protein n=1 Tax=Emticicia sp. C21 TaxID=2302915 RepID=UPI000E355B04|nr:outer membrane beta-barrel family protein [Emticicia sp. C21]RFS17974.1 TonB-dependent receptor [Emticicia sp. C21]
MKSLNCLLLGLFFAVPLFAFSQTSTINGILRDSTTNNPLPFATISLFKNNASQPVKATFTDETGKFSIPTDTGSFTILCTFIGYADKRIPVTIRNNESRDLQTIFLVSTTKSLGAVTVTARKPLIEQTDDKIIFNTDADPSTKTENALDILRKTPFVSVDGNDNITVNGQSNFRILLNGRETGMFSQNVSQALKSFPGASIVKIEVITNPSAKYDAEGVGGVLNIVTQKQIIGYNGNASLTLSSIHNTFGNLSFNLKKGKVGVSLNYFYNAIGLLGNQAPPFFADSRTDAINSQTYSSRILNGITIQQLFQNFGNAEISYDLDKYKTISIYGSVTGGFNNLSTTTSIHTIFPTTTTTSFLTLQNNTNSPNYNVGSDFIKKFKDIPEKEFSIRLFTEYSKNDRFLDSYQDNTETDRYIINNNYAHNTQTTLQTDYILPMKRKQKIETGLKFILRNATSDYESLIKTSPTEEYMILPANTNNFNYLQQVYSAYGSYNFALKKFPFRIGLRMEHTEVDGNFNGTETAVRQSYTNLIPNIQTSTQITKEYKMVLSYGQRIQRPFINSLNPFINNNDTLNISYGNPALRPQLIHNLTLQNNFAKGKVFAGLTLGGSYSNNKIIQIINFNKETGVSTTTNENLGKESQISLNGNITANFSKVWNMSVNSNLNYTYIKNSSDLAQQNSGLTGFIGVSNNFKVNPKFTISTFVGNFKPPIGLQGYTSSQWFYNITPSYKLFKDKITITLAAARFITKYVTVRTIQKDINFRSENLNSFQARNFRIGIVWNFGKLKENVSKKKGINNDDVL